MIKAILQIGVVEVPVFGGLLGGLLRFFIGLLAVISGAILLVVCMAFGLHNIGIAVKPLFKLEQTKTGFVEENVEETSTSIKPEAVDDILKSKNLDHLKREGFQKSQSHPTVYDNYSRVLRTNETPVEGVRTLLYEEEALIGDFEVYIAHKEHFWKQNSYAHFEHFSSNQRVDLVRVLSGDIYSKRFRDYSDVICVGMSSFPSDEIEDLSDKRSTRLCKALEKANIFKRDEVHKMWSFDLGRALDKSESGSQSEKLQRTALIIGVRFINEEKDLSALAREIVSNTTIQELKLWRFSRATIAEAISYEGKTIYLDAATEVTTTK